MKISMKKSAAAILFAVAVMFSAAVVNATTVSEAQTLLATLKSETQSVTITGKNAESKDRPGLIGKVDNASFAVDSAKFCGAIQKLNDFKVKVNQLIAAGKINQTPTDAAGNTLVTGTQLLADADAAIKAINDLQIQSTGVGCF